MSKDVTIGIDLGTSNSCVATVSGDKPRVLANTLGERTTASVVAFREDGSIDVGNQAKAQIILDPKHTVCSAKRLIGRFYFSEELRKARAICNYEIVPGESHSVRIQIRQEQFSLPEISAFVLKEMKQIAERELGCVLQRQSAPGHQGCGAHCWTRGPAHPERADGCRPSVRLRP